MHADPMGWTAGGGCYLARVEALLDEGLVLAHRVEHVRGQVAVHLHLLQPALQPLAILPHVVQLRLRLVQRMLLRLQLLQPRRPSASAPRNATPQRQALLCKVADEKTSVAVQTGQTRRLLELDIGSTFAEASRSTARAPLSARSIATLVPQNK